MRLTYVVGEPGVGKTTLLRALRGNLLGVETSKPFAHVLYESIGAVELGRTEGTFAGTDRLSMNVQPKVLEWASMPEYGDVFGEGDRLANAKFFQGMKDLGYEMAIIHLRNPELAHRRRYRRNLDLGTRQDPTWVRGRQTKVQRLASEWCNVQLDAGDPDLVEHARNIGIFGKLWEAGHAGA